MLFAVTQGIQEVQRLGMSNNQIHRVKMSQFVMGIDSKTRQTRSTSPGKSPRPFDI